MGDADAKVIRKNFPLLKIVMLKITPTCSLC